MLVSRITVRPISPTVTPILVVIPRSMLPPCRLPPSFHGLPRVVCLLAAVRLTACLRVRRQLRPRAYVDEPFLVSRDDHLDALVDRPIVFAPSASHASRARLREQNLAGTA